MEDMLFSLLRLDTLLDHKLCTLVRWSCWCTVQPHSRHSRRVCCCSTDHACPDVRKQNKRKPREKQLKILKQSLQALKCELLKKRTNDKKISHGNAWKTCCFSFCGLILSWITSFALWCVGAGGVLPSSTVCAYYFIV